MQKLKVRAVGDVLVQDYVAMRNGVRRFIGRRLSNEHGKTWVDPDTQQLMRQAVFVPLEGADEVDDCAEVRKAVRLGDLEAADEATAKACGVEVRKAFNKKPGDAPKAKE